MNSIIFDLYFWGVPFFSLAVNVVLLFSLLFSKKDGKTIAFIVYVINTILWVLCSLLMKAEIFNPNIEPIFWCQLCTTFSFLMPISIYIYLTIYAKCFSIKKTLPLALGILICILIIYFGPLINEAYAIRNEADLIIGWFYDPDLTLSKIVFVYFFFTILVIIFKSINLIMHKKVTFNQIGIFMIGSLIMFVGFGCNMIQSIGQYPVDIAATLVTSILLFIFLYKNKMFEFKVIIAQGIILFSVLFIFLAGYILLIRYILQNSLQVDTSYLLIILTILLAILMQPLVIIIKRLLNKYINKYANDQHIAINQFHINISNNLDIDNISDELLFTINKALHTPKSCLLLYQKENNVMAAYKCSSVLENINVSINLSNPIIKFFEKYDNYILNINELNTIPELKSMWESEKRELKLYNIELIVPLKCRKKIIGLLFLMSKEDKKRYNSYDYDILKSLAAMVGVALDNAYMFKEAQQEAYNDSLTGLYNHKYFTNALAEMSNDDKNAYKTISLLMIDLDNFKLYNDLYGFKAGDDAIIRSSEIISETLKEKGIVTRYSGQEFAVILPNCDTFDAFEIAETIRINIEKEFSNSATNILLPGTLTTSIGLCNYPINAANTNELLKNCLFALYVAKNNGKNKTVDYNVHLKEDKDDEDLSNIDNSIMSKYRSTIFALTAAIDTKDHFTFAHSQNVAYYTIELAKALNLDKNTTLLLEEAALLHDIGKIGIPESILSKKGRLTDEEYDIMKRHVELCVTTIKFLPSTNYVIPIIFSHHERFDGRGYPRGLKEKEIPLGGRILAIADAFDAMTSQRPYKDPLSIEFAIGELEKNINKQFDGELVKVFIKMIKENKIEVKSFKMM